MVLSTWFMIYLRNRLVAPVPQHVVAQEGSGSGVGGLWISCKHETCKYCTRYARVHSKEQDDDYCNDYLGLRPPKPREP